MSLDQGLGSAYDTSYTVAAATTFLSRFNLQAHTKSHMHSIGSLMCGEISRFKIIDSTLRYQSFSLFATVFVNLTTSDSIGKGSNLRIPGSRQRRRLRLPELWMILVWNT